MALISAFASYTVKFVVLIGVAAGGYMLGRRQNSQKKLKN